MARLVNESLIQHAMAILETTSHTDCPEAPPLC